MRSQITTILRYVSFQAIPLSFSCSLQYRGKIVIFTIMRSFITSSNGGWWVIWLLSGIFRFFLFAWLIVDDYMGKNVDSFHRSLHSAYCYFVLHLLCSAFNWIFFYFGMLPLLFLLLFHYIYLIFLVVLFTSLTFFLLYSLLFLLLKLKVNALLIVALRNRSFSLIPLSSE